MFKDTLLKPISIVIGDSLFMDYDYYFPWLAPFTQNINSFWLAFTKHSYKYILDSLYFFVFITKLGSFSLNMFIKLLNSLWLSILIEIPNSLIPSASILIDGSLLFLTLIFAINSF